MRTSSTKGLDKLTVEKLGNFLAVATAGRIADAAGPANRTRQSQLSREIRELEQIFGQPLFDRSGKQMRPTAFGERLAAIVRLHFSALDEFKATCRAEPKRLRLAAGNSVLTWMVLDRMAEIRRRLPDTDIDLVTCTTAEAVRGLRTNAHDFAVIRTEDLARGADRLSQPLESQFLAKVGYAIYVARSLAKPAELDDPRRLLERVPVATSIGGQFRDLLEEAARKAGIKLRVALSCTTFTQAARAAHSGAYAAVIPDLAPSEFPPATYARLDLPVLRSHHRRLHLVWNSSALAVRSSLGQARLALGFCLGPAPSLPTPAGKGRK